MGFDKPQAEGHSLPKAGLSPCVFSLVELQAHAAVFLGTMVGFDGHFKEIIKGSQRESGAVCV